LPDQKIELTAPAHLRWRRDRALEVAALRIRGAGRTLTGEVALDASYALARRADPQATATLALRRAALEGVDPVRPELGAQPGRTRGWAELEAHVGRAELHVTADVPLATGVGGAPTLAARGPVSLHVRSKDLILRDLPLIARQLSRRGVNGGAVSFEADV